MGKYIILETLLQELALWRHRTESSNGV